MDLFIGKQECSVDDKRRFSLPPKYRPLYGAETTPSGYSHHAVLIPWYSGSLAIFPMGRWAEVQSRLSLLDYTTPDFLEAMRACLPRMERTHTDPEGRLSLTPDHHAWLRLASKGKDKVMVVGVGAHCEAWNAAEWAEVERTGRNPASRPGADVEYDRQLEILMRAAVAAEATRPPESSREPEPTGNEE